MPAQEEIENEVYPPLYSIMEGGKYVTSPMNKRLGQSWKRNKKFPGVVKLVPGGHTPHVWAMYVPSHGNRVTREYVPVIGPGSGSIAVFHEDPRETLENDKWLQRHVGRFMRPGSSWGGEWAPPTFVQYGAETPLGPRDSTLGQTLTMVEAAVARAIRGRGIRGSHGVEFDEVGKTIGQGSIDVEALRDAIKQWSDRVLAAEYTEADFGDDRAWDTPAKSDLRLIAAVTTAAKSRNLKVYTNRVGAKLNKAASSPSYDLFHRASEKLRNLSGEHAVEADCPKCGAHYTLMPSHQRANHFSRFCRRSRPNPAYDPARVERVEAGAEAYDYDMEEIYHRTTRCNTEVEVNRPDPSELLPSPVYHWEAHVPDGHWLEY